MAQKIESSTALRNIAVIGLGITGLSCVRYLVQQGLNVSVFDSRQQPPMLAEFRKEFSHIPVHLGAFSETLLGNMDELVVSPGVSVQEPAILAAQASGAQIVGDIELFVRQATAPIVAITGSNGKSTVTTLVGEMAKASGMAVEVAGNIGVPVLELLGSDEPDLYVLELSSFQLETTYSLRAKCAVILNISADHMDRYRTLADYTEAKRVVHHNADVQIINRDDPVVAQLPLEGKRALYFTLNNGNAQDFTVASKNGEKWLVHGKDFYLRVSDLKIMGEHNVANALASLAIGFACGFEKEAMCNTLRTFQGLAHRTQWVATHQGITWINDSKGTNVGATVAAIAGMAGPLILIAGGDAKGADLSPLQEAVKNKVKCVVLIGRDAHLIDKAVRDVVTTVFASDMKDAVSKAAKVATNGDSVLLSPACASLDMYKNYQHRGDVFSQEVRELCDVAG